MNEIDLAQELADVSGVIETDPRWRNAVDAINDMKKRNPDIAGNLNPDDPSLVITYIALKNHKRNSDADAIQRQQTLQMDGSIVGPESGEPDARGDGTLPGKYPYPCDPDVEIGAIANIAKYLERYITANVWHLSDPNDNECVSFWLSRFDSFVVTRTLAADRLPKDAFRLMQMVTNHLLAHHGLDDVHSVSGHIIDIHRHSTALVSTHGASLVPAAGIAAAEFVRFDLSSDEAFIPSVKLNLGQSHAFYNSNLYEAGMRIRTRLFLQRVAEQHAMANDRRFAEVSNIKRHRLDADGKRSLDFGIIMLGSSSDAQKLKFLLATHKGELLDTWFGPDHPFAIYVEFGEVARRITRADRIFTASERLAVYDDIDRIVTTSEKLAVLDEDIIEAIWNRVQSSVATYDVV